MEKTNEQLVLEAARDWKVCHDKRTYKTTQEAKAAAKRTAEWLNKPMRYYTCRICSKLHLTSKNKRRRREKRA